jgi:RNA polymerase sigma-70 factor (ECF subfamily)
VVAPRPLAAPLPEDEGRVSSVSPPDFRTLFETEFEYVWHTLRRLGVRFASDYRKLARHRREVLELAPEARDPAPSAFDRAAFGETLDLARRALDTLPLERRAVFVLHELDECAMPEVAEALGVPLNTAYSRLRLAREDLSTALRSLRSRGAR